MTTPTNASGIAASFSAFLESLRDTSPMSANEASERIWHDMAEIRAALHDYCDWVDRKKRWTIAEIFQDLIAHYLRRTLPEAYHVKIEQSVGTGKKIQPDIIVFKDDTPHAAIEVKVRVAWNRAYFAEGKHEERAKRVAGILGIPERRVLHIIESPDKGGAYLTFSDPPSNTFILFDHSPNLKPGRNSAIASANLRDFSEIIEAIVDERDSDPKKR